MLESKPKIGTLFIATTRFKNMGAGLVEGSYHDRKLKEVDEYVDKLSKKATVYNPGIIYTREELTQAIDAFTINKVDCVFALFLSWTEDFLWVRFLRDMPPLPILFGCRIRDNIDFKNTTDETDFVEFLSAGGLVGSLEASGSIARFARPMLATAIGTMDELVSQAHIYAKAAAVRRALHNSVFGLLASFNEVMWSTYVDPYNFFAKAGPELRFLSVTSLLNEIEAVSNEAVHQTIQTLTSKYELLPDVAESKFEASVRASLAMETLARKNGASMIVLNDVDPVLLTEVGLRPGFLPCPGTTDVSIVPEGDLGGGLALYILKMLSNKHVSFIEPFHIDYPNDCFAGGHAGPNDYTDPAGKVLIARDVRFAKTSYKHAGAPFAWFTIPEGRKTMLHMSQSGNSFKMVCTQVDALPCEHFITSYSHGLFRPVGQSCQSLFDKLIKIGVTQHYAVVDGDYTKELAALATQMDFEYIQL